MKAIIPFLFAFFLILSSCATGSGGLFEAELSPSNKSVTSGTKSSDSDTEAGRVNENDETETDADESPAPGFYISSSPSGAHIYMNGFLVGQTPVHLEPRRGTYRIRAEKSGYYASTITLRYALGDVHEIKLHLEQITGKLIVIPDAPNTSLWAGGQVFSSGREIELPVGRHSIEARAFGYETKFFTVEILEKQTAEIKLEMTPVPFRVLSMQLARGAFSPLDPGIYSRMSARVEVSAPGSAVYEIHGTDGRRVYGPKHINFSQHRTQITWNGRNNAGYQLPDGSYVLLFEAEDGSTFDQIVKIDSSETMRYRSTFSTGPGSLLAAVPGQLPQHSMQAGFLIFSHRESAGSITPFSGSIRYAPSQNQEISASAGWLYLNSADDQLTLPFVSAVLSQSLFGAADSSFSGALQLRASYRHEHSQDFFAADTGLGVSLPLALNHGAFTLALSPELSMLGFTTNSFWAYGRAALIIDAGSVMTAVSSAVRTEAFGSEWGNGTIIKWPLSSAAEIHWLIPKTALVLSAGGILRMHPDDGWYISAGGGMQFMLDGR